MRPELKGIIGVFREALSRLALPADQQLKYLDKFGTPGCVDELALQFDDGYCCLPEMVEEGVFTPEQAELMRPVDALLDKMSGEHNAELWEPEALHESAGWEEVRRLARTALESIGDTGKEYEGLMRIVVVPAKEDEGKGVKRKTEWKG